MTDKITVGTLMKRLKGVIPIRKKNLRKNKYGVVIFIGKKLFQTFYFSHSKKLLIINLKQCIKYYELNIPLCTIAYLGNIQI